MLRAITFVLLGITAASSALAGHLYGTIRENGQSLRGVEIVLNCAGETATGRTDRDGVYRLFLRRTGSCQIVLEPSGRRAVGSLYSYDRPTAYDFDLVREGGRWALRRR
jgi:hypothetical protein